MHSWDRSFDGAQQVAVEEAVEIARQAALNANFGGATIPGFLRAAHDFVERKRVGVGGLRSAAESAETAADKADVGEVDVAVDDVGDAFTDGFAAQMIRRSYHGLQARTFRSRQRQAPL